MAAVAKTTTRRRPTTLATTTEVAEVEAAAAPTSPRTQEARTPDLANPPSDNLVLPRFPTPISGAPVGGRLTNFVNNWLKIYSSQWTIDVLRWGYRIEFASLPPLSSTPISFPPPANLARREAVSEQAKQLLSKGVIELVNWKTPGFYSRFFVVPKPEGKWRSILDLSALNVYVQKESFKMETAEHIRALLQEGEWLASLDLHDAYFHVPVHKKHRKYLRFVCAGKVYQFTALPMGLSSSGRVFTRVIKEIKQFVHPLGINLHQYIDDWLVRAKDFHTAELHTQFILKLTIHLGFLVNYHKSEIRPSQDIIFLGYHIHSREGLLRPSEERWDRILHLIPQFLHHSHLPARTWQQAIGLLASTEKLVPGGMLRLRFLQLHMLDQWSPRWGSPHYPITITAKVTAAIQWWLTRANVFAGVPFRLTDPKVLVFSDATPLRWGGHIDTIEVGDWWTPQEKQLHINVQELLSAERVLVHFSSIIQNRTILLSMDNSTAVAYLKKQGGTHSKELMLIAYRILAFLEQLNTLLVCRHIPGRLNVHADRISRQGQILGTEWSIHPRITQALWQVWGTPQIDLFATRFNNKVPTYVSPIPDRGAFAVDALSMDWTNMYAYAYPPTAILNQVITKIQKDKCTVILIAPHWSGQAWYPALLDLLVDWPLTIPPLQRLLKQPQSTVYHQHPEIFNFHAWMLSADVLKRKAFLQKLQCEWQDHKKTLVSKSMILSGLSSQIGVANGFAILSKPLYLQ